ncbi:copper-translocating P-type ATPase [Sutcliffiella horikoshii]|uniref:Cd(2+)-exporting ATPase n=1 Tax=Sutcliffiella horikoshii TaxID=79883 RepID=A0ABM6KLA3_9BACI|nr:MULTISPECIES: heavy metal translocating P-type ATPase [Bacillaceae]ART77271.1 copper-translocating P-type ATPase [Sutcliffiella horikoshii]
MKNKEEQTYRIQGLTCANCAQKFENNVKKIEGVTDARVNFGASKISVSGAVSVGDIEKAGAFDKLKVSSEQEELPEEPSIPFYKKHATVLLSFVFLVAGWIAFFQQGEEHISTIILFAASIVIGGYRLFFTGINNLIRLQFDMKTLMTIAIIGAAIIGEWGEGATVVILFAISEALESYSMEKARASIRSLMNVSPKQATILIEGTEKLISVKDVKIGDRMLVKPGQKIAMDGNIVKGGASISEAAITGESIPVSKCVNDEVFAGTFNEDGLLEVEVTKRVEDTTISKIIHLVEEAQAERAPSQAFVDKFAKYYTPLIIIIAFLVATVPPLFMGLDWNTWIYQGLAVLVVGCPCALVISTPIAIVTAIGNAARNGVLIKGGVFLEEVGRIKAIAFDKTGTLTRGAPEVTDVHAFYLTEEELLKIIATLEGGSTHPLASAILQKAEEVGVADTGYTMEHFESIAGKGIKGSINGILYQAGSPNWFLGQKHPEIEGLAESIHQLQNAGKTVIVVGTSEKIFGVLGIRDEIRDSSASSVKNLREIGISNLYMLTGDNDRTAEAIGHEVEIDHVKSSLLPEDKLRYIKELREKHGSMMMVGDGINDAPALAASSVGVAMGGAGTDTALETADVALMGDDLRKLPFTIRLSRKALTIIKQNIGFSLGLKVLALLLVIPGWLTLWIAIFADMGATLLVTLNSLRLLKVKDEMKK